MPLRNPASAQAGEATFEDIKHRAKSGLVWSVLRQLGTRGIGVATFVILARLLTPETFGLMTAVAVFLAIADVVMEQGLGQAIIQRHDLRPAHLDTAFWMQLGVALLVCLIGVVLAPWLAQLYGFPNLSSAIRVSMLVTPMSALSAVQDALLQRNLRFKSLAQRRLGANLIGAIIAISMAATGYGVWSLVGQQLGAAIAGTALLWYVSSWRPGFDLRLTALRELLGFSIHLFFLRGVNMVKTQSDNFLMALFLGPTPLGIYAVAYRVVDSATDIFLTPISSLGLAVFSRLQHQPEALRRAYSKSVFATSVVGFPASVGLGVLAPEIIQVGFGTKWAAAAPVLQVLAISVFNRSMGQANTALLLAKGRSFFRLIVAACYMLTSVALLLVFIDRGVIAVSWIHVGCNFVIIPITGVMVGQVLNWHYRRQLLLLLWPLFAAVAMAAAIIPLRWNLAGAIPAWGVIAATVPVGAIVYGGVLWLASAEFRGLLREAVAWLKNRLRRLRPERR